MASLVRVWISFVESATPAVYQLGDKTMLIGREESCDIPVIDSSVSRNHGSIAFESGQYVLRDHGSSNGTFVNGEAVRLHTLKQGDTIRFGEVIFLFQEGEVTPELAKQLQEQAAPNLEITSAQPVKQVFVPPQQNNPVKVMISSQSKEEALVPVEGEHYTSRTIPISISKSRAVASKTKTTQSVQSGKDESFTSYVWGACGVLGIIPAIIYGHKANPVTPEEQKNQIKGLSYGYLFLFLWGFGSLFLWIYGDKISLKTKAIEVQSVLVAPQFKNGLKLLQGELLWCPTRRQIQTIFNPPSKDSKEFRQFNQIYGELRDQWSTNLVVCEPEILRAIPAFSDKDHLKFVTEDFLTKPNFLDYNSTVVPEKKDPISHFLIPSLSSWMFFARDQNLQAKMERFNGEDFPWRNAYRGMMWKGDRFDFNASQIPEIRLFFILKPGTSFYRLTIHTREGNLNSDYAQKYHINYVPAEYLAIVVYVNKTAEVLAIHTNSIVFESAEKELMAKSLIRASVPLILEKKAEEEAVIPNSFPLISLTEAMLKYPVGSPKK